MTCTLEIELRGEQTFVKLGQLLIWCFLSRSQTMYHYTASRHLVRLRSSTHLESLQQLKQIATGFLFYFVPTFWFSWEHFSVSLKFFSSREPPTGDAGNSPWSVLSLIDRARRHLSTQLSVTITELVRLDTDNRQSISSPQYIWMLCVEIGIPCYDKSRRVVTAYCDEQITR